MIYYIIVVYNIIHVTVYIVYEIESEFVVFDRPNNCGETNLWKESYYIPGARIMV